MMERKKSKSVDLLPEFLRTDKNSKFLSSTLDQLIQPTELERLDGFAGSKITPNYNANTDVYISEDLALRKNYQLEPALVTRDEDGKISDVIAFDDLINEISVQGGIVNNFDRLFRSHHYSYNPFIDWDKFVNYQEYYWLPTGPDTVIISGVQNSTSTYTISDNTAETAFVFSTSPTEVNPLITLYRGNTYKFEINSHHQFYIKSNPITGEDDQYNNGITNNGTSTGVITFVVDNYTTSTLFYISGDQIENQGQIVILTPNDNTVLNIDDEIVGKKEYVLSSGVSLSNGMKIRFDKDVYPELYQDKEYFVEGVGKSIKLIDYALLSSGEDMADIYNENFDASNFDTFPFDNFKRLPLIPEYITINRASKDLNPWSRYNRWVHKDVIKFSAQATNQIPVYPTEKRARRPIIEFIADLQLYNFGSIGIKNVDYIDTITVDAFGQVEGKPGYHVDGSIPLQQGNRVIFNADTDEIIRGKIYEVNFIVIDGKTRIELKETADHIPVDNASVAINFGNQYGGTNWWFNGSEWVYAQQHTKLNEEPFFDLFDNQGNSYSSIRGYYNSDFKGNRIFGYTHGTGVNDPVLGFPLKYQNSAGVGSYLFSNYFMTDSFGVVQTGISTVTVPASSTYVKIYDDVEIYKNVWEIAEDYRIPILQFQTISETTSTLKITAVDSPSVDNISIEIFFESDKVPTNQFVTSSTGGIYTINFVDQIPLDTDVLIKIYTDLPANSNGYYETPLSLTNNPFNGVIKELTLSEISDHLHTIVHRAPSFLGEFPGNNNLRDLYDISKYGSRLIASVDPIIFANFFVGKKEHSLINALTRAADQYNQFKMSFLKKISEVGIDSDSVTILDTVLKELNTDKDLLSPYYLSDMVAYGTDKNVRSWVVSNVENKIYPIASNFTLDELSLKSVLVYLNDVQLLVDKDYKFTNDSSVEILTELSINDKLKIVDYYKTEGCFIPPTPTKLGLYPKFEPLIYFDDTFVGGNKKVIQCHDGSIIVAYDDYRDDIILEFEKRIYNNLKAKYRHELYDINSVIPGAFRNTQYSVNEVNSILQRDFIKWAGFYGIDYSKNTSFDINNPFTWNYNGSYNQTLEKSISGHWRSVYKYFYDTDRPHTHPWEMLGFTEMPDWWETQYGPAPYTSGNEILWNDIELGIIRQGDRQGVHNLYVRPMLSQMLPVNEQGNLVDPTVSLLTNITSYNQRQNWIFGDHSPAETAWRRSSYWPFAVQKLLALTNPVKYSSLMYDPVRVQKNKAKQWTYGPNFEFLNLKNILIHADNNTLTSGYSVYISEIGKQRTSNYVASLKTDLAKADVNLFYKVGGFVSKNKLQIIVDAYDPLSTNPGAILPQEDYELILNISNPVRSIGVSGLIIQKSNGKFVVNGYDKFNPYFTIYEPARTTNSPTITVGGVSEPYLTWSNSSTGGNNGLTAADLTTANQSTTSRYYQQGQIVLYQNKFYRVKVSHRQEATFNTALFQVLPSLPSKGGATVQAESKFSKIEKKIPYGTEFSTIQEIYDLIIGYGAWLEAQGFIFDQFNQDLNEIMNWKYTAKEFLYWTTQNWANNSIITLSPFADQLKYKFIDSIVDNIFNSFYDYGILQVSGLPFPQRELSVTRDNGVCTIRPLNSIQGIYFAQLNSIQKEHAMVFNNTTIFNDTIYDIETGYRQKRIKIVGFRTKNWDGDFFSPGFVYDSAQIKNWKKYTEYRYSDTVKYAGKYYSAKKNVNASETFDFNSWVLLTEKPVEDLIPNFDYKINQFEDFYSLDIDNFDSAQQKMAQHLIGYTPRVYLNNIFTNPIAQYKFYQGFIKEKGTRNSITKLSKASIHNLQGEIEFNEEWAFRIGHYGSYETFKEIELPLVEGNFVENPQIINFVTEVPTIPNDLIYYRKPTDLVIKPEDYVSSLTFVTAESNFIENNSQLMTAGYPRLDDITATVFDENSILDIANNNLIQQGAIFWLGFKSNGDWDVLRYTNSLIKIIDASINVPGEELLLTTDDFHNLTVGDLISVVNFTTQVNGIYKIVAIPQLDQIIVQTSLSSITTEPDEPGLLFYFERARLDNFDELPPDQTLLKLQYGTKYWIDRDLNDKWAVYEKVKNYSSKFTKFSSSPLMQKLGWSISKKKGSDVIVVGSPGYVEDNNYGKIYVYKQVDGSMGLILSYTLNESKNYHVPGTENEFGYSVFYDNKEFINLQGEATGYGLIFAGAPATSNVIGSGVIGNVRYSTGTGVTSSLTQEGLIKISGVDTILTEEATQFVLLSPYPSNYERFGSSIYVEGNTSTKLLLVGAPGTESVGSGTVYSYVIDNSNTSSFVVQPAASGIKLVSNVTLNVGSQWGSCISGSEDASVIAISAPGYNLGSGLVQIFNKTSHQQTILGNVGENSKFGEKVLVSPDGTQLFISAPNVKNDDLSYGKVFCYDVTQSGLFTLTQVLINPLAELGMSFGKSIDINNDNNLLVISALGTNNFVETTFDNYSAPSTQLYVNDAESDPTGFPTVFDAASTTFHDSIEKTGTVYLYDRKDTRFVLADEIKPKTLSYGDNYGFTVTIDGEYIYAGMPAYDSSSVISGVHQFRKIDSSVSGWKKLRYQENAIDVNLLQKNVLIQSLKEEVIEYLDVIDPVKGKIAGIADREIKYKSNLDPATYSVGNSNTVNDTTNNWTKEHVGELWWDLSTVKYMWYEQGELVYRKNNWGKTFPGSSIDIYEWVESVYLPSEWSSLADTAEGLTKNISGQPKHIDDSVVSVRQTIDPISGIYTNYYYFWVKNKVIVPSVKNRKLSAYQVASIVLDPVSAGLKFIEVLSKDALAIANSKSLLVNDQIHLNVSFDIIDNKIPKHTEWLLLEEGSPTSVPNVLLEKKLIDSLLGHDNLGNLVPDPALSFRERYGIGVRPRQTWFKNRFEALRNLVEFVNSVLIENQITGNYSFVNLNKQENIPAPELNEYDLLVEDIEDLNSNLVDTKKLSQGKLSATVRNGKLYSIVIEDPGFGYQVPPVVSISNDQSSIASVVVEIDSFGRISSARIINAGSGFEQPPILEVRPFTVVVTADQDSNGLWAKYIYSNELKNWVRVRTQKYNTTLYWYYVDWQSSSYNPFIDYSYTVDEIYQLDSIADISVGQYVKIRNSGNGNYIIVEKIDNDLGTFGNGFNLVYSQNGTIQLSQNIWNFLNSNSGFDQNERYDQTLFDQTPDIELGYILTALKEDIFIGELKVNWNLFFFNAVKYALSEQKLLDWAFKTSFINVRNIAGNLDQRSIYKLQDSSFYQNYLQEVKPYRSNIRNFITNYSKVDLGRTYITDFDLPSIYNKETGRFESVTLGDSSLESYPWKSWYDNYTCGVESVNISYAGKGYTSIPSISIQTAIGDTGSGAVARAYIRSGEIISVEVLNPGKGYVIPPIITVIGGGATDPAILHPRLSNNKIRTNKVGMKFDRITRSGSYVNSSVVDTFICNGTKFDYVLNWLASPDKLKFTVTLDGSLVIGSEYTVEYYTEEYNGYSKKFNKIVFLNTAPESGKRLTVQYEKSIDLFNAAERVLGYYHPTTGMPGIDLPQLMTGMEYPNTLIDTLPFDYTSKWDFKYSEDLYVPFGVSSWEGDVVHYNSVQSISTSTNIGGTWTAITLSTTTGILVGQYVNIISTTTNAFSTSSVKVVGVNVVNNQVTVDTTTVGVINSGSVIEFWSYELDSPILDSSIDGGTWSQTTSNYFIGALGINPEDLIITGDGFLTNNALYSPEELVPGHTLDTIGINVYTKNSFGSPIIFSGGADVIAGIVTVSKLSMVPPGENYITVSFNNTLFVYKEDSAFTSSDQFTINWATNELIVSAQSISGRLGYTVLGIGGGQSGQGAGVIDNAFITVNSTATTEVQSLAGINSVKSVYVTLNGTALAAITTTTDYGYMLTYSSDDSRRATVKVYNLPGGENTIQAWFFSNPYTYFNEVKEQEFNIDGTPQSTLSLLYPPGNIEPSVANILVEIDDGTGRRRLRPPYISYYEVTNSINNTFLINNFVNDPSKFTPGAFDITNTKVYINGRSLRPGFDFTVDSGAGTVTILSILLKVRDVVAIVGLVQGIIPQYQYDFNVVGSTLILTPSVSNCIVKVITYTDHDGMLMRTERFVGSPIKRYKISRPVLNDNYVWVQVNGIPLTSRLDFEILDDQVTVQIRDAYTHSTTDDVVIMSIASDSLASTVLGYRIFNDIFNRTHFKRLSKNHSTYLTQPLSFTHTEIHVADAQALTPPIPSKKIPGIVLIDGERIEFNQIDGNILKQLRRSTLGTAPSFYSLENTKVIDQSINQNIPYTENNYKQVHLTSSTVNVYTISTISNSLIGDGITLSMDSEIPATDQVLVFYGGRPLRKFGTYYHDISVAFDSPTFSIKGTTSTVAVLPQNAMLNDAYVVTATNQVWVYTGSSEPDAIYGYVYRGLTYLEPEFSINTATQELILNIGSGIQENIKLTILKKDFARNSVWNNEITSTKTKSLMDSTTYPARFLQAQPAELPNKFYYGGDR